MLKALVEYFIFKLVDKPELVKIIQTEIDGKDIIEIRVAANDLTKVIGGDGRTFKALRALTNAVAGQGNRSIVVDIIS